MSSERDVQRALDAGDLCPLPMRLETDAQERVFLLSREIQELVLGPYRNKQHEIRAGKLRADMESFVRGENISMCLTPRKAGTAYFGLLHPTGSAMIDLRSRDPRPSLRILGHFLKVDCFVALGWWPRRVTVDWSEKEPLGDDDRRWAQAIYECSSHWFNILPNCVPVAGKEGDKYVSSKLVIV